MSNMYLLDGKSRTASRNGKEVAAMQMPAGRSVGTIGLVFLTLILSVPVVAAGEKLIFVYDTYPPYEFEEQGKVVGADVDIIREVCRRLGHEGEFANRPWRRALEEVKTGKADAIFSLFKTDERERFLYYPAEAINFEKNVVIARKGREKVEKLEDLKRKTVGVVINNSYGDAFDAAVKRKDFQVEECSNYENLLLKLDGGRMDFAIINELVFDGTVKKIGLQGRFEIHYQQSIDPMYVAFSRAKGEKAKKLADDFDKILSEMKKNGDIQKIIQNY